MAIVRKVKNNFTTGVISQGVLGRMDLEKYAAACERIENAIVRPQGGVSKRPGTEFVGQFGTASEVYQVDEHDVEQHAYLFPFQYNSEQSYILCFAEQKIYIIKDGDFVLEYDHGPRLAIATPYHLSDVPFIRFVQSKDVFFIAHKDYAVRKLTRFSDRTWSLEPFSFGYSNVFQVRSLSATGTGGSNFLKAQVEKQVGDYGSNIMSGSTASTQVIQYMVSVISPSGESQPETCLQVTVDSEWPAGANITISWYPPKDYFSLSGANPDSVNGIYDVYIVSGSIKQTTTKISATEKYYHPIYKKRGANLYIYVKVSTAATPNTYYWAITTTAYGSTNSTVNPPGEDAGEVFYAEIGTAVSMLESAKIENVATWTAATATTVSSGTVTPPGAPDYQDGTDVQRYIVYKNVNGYFGYAGYVEEDQSQPINKKRSFRDNNLAPDYGSGPAVQHSPFIAVDGGTTGGYPGSIGLYQQRLIFGGTGENRQTVYMTETGVYNSFGKHEPLIDSDAIEATIDGKQANEIKHITDLKYGIIFTSGGEYMMSAGRNVEAIAPTSIAFQMQSAWGCSDVPPLCIGDYLLFILGNGKTVRDMTYQFSQDGYVGNELSILADDVLDSRIIDWAYQRSPFSCIWCVLENGSLLSFTYLREQEVYAWATHKSDGGKFLSVSVVREGGKDRVYFLVKRGDNLLVERMFVREYGDSIQDASYLDSAVYGEFDGSTTTISDPDLAHLYGSTNTTALIDGSVFPVEIEEDGGTYSFESPIPPHKVLVGLPYTMTVQTVDPEITADGGAIIGDKRSVAEVTIMLRETAGIKVGWDDAHLETVKLPHQANWSTQETVLIGGTAVSYYASAVPLFTGYQSLTIPGHYREGAGITIVSDLPLPCTVLSVMEKISIG